MKRVGILGLVVVLALAVVGIGFGHWSKMLYINGTVDTGELNLCFFSAISNDSGVTIDPGKDKHVGTTEVYCADPWDPEQPGPVVPCQQAIMMVVENAYPCYEAGIEYMIWNVGTIPAKIQSIKINGTPVVPGQTVTIGWLEITHTTLEVGTQIDPEDPPVPGGQIMVPGDLHIHVLQEYDDDGDPQTDPVLTPENASMSFVVEIEAVQWNNM